MRREEGAQRDRLDRREQPKLLLEQRAQLGQRRRAVLGAAVSAAMSFALTPGRADAKDGKNGVYWISPKDGATVERSFTVRMGVKGYELAPASEGLQEGTGHHHIVVDGGVVEKGVAIPFDATHLHFGKAQKEAAIELEPGPKAAPRQFNRAYLLRRMGDLEAAAARRAWSRSVLAARGVYGAGQPASGEAGDQIREAQHRFTVARFLTIRPAPVLYCNRALNSVVV